MIPYFSWTTIPLGFIDLQVWGLFVAIGFLAGTFMAVKLAKQRGDDPEMIYGLVPLLAFAALIGGRIGHVLLYDPAYYAAHPLESFALWQGGSSFFGGFIACIIVGALYFWRKKLNALRYADVLVFGLPFGKFFGRIGCFLIHDHPGTATDFFLGVQYPDGIVRHDLGLYLAISALGMSFLFLYLSRCDRPVGTYIAIFTLWYGAVRILLDPLRVVDVRYAGFTPAQWLSVMLVAIGVGTLIYIRQQKQAVQHEAVLHDVDKASDKA